MDLVGATTYNCMNVKNSTTNLSILNVVSIKLYCVCFYSHYCFDLDNNLDRDIFTPIFIKE